MAMVILGAGGGLGQALSLEVLKQYPDDTVYAVSRQPQPQALVHERLMYSQLADYSDASLAPWVAAFDESGESLQGVISTVGMLHDEETFPEKKLSDIEANNLIKLFEVNAVKPLLALQAFTPILDKQQTQFWVQLSAKVGSIEDNYLGGWYAYRASKAALNMMLKTAAIELKRTHKRLVVAAIHPGTTDTRLSAPFQQRIPAERLYTPALSAQRILAVIEQLTPEHTGELWHWDGTRLPY